MSETILDVENLTKEFGSLRAVDGISTGFEKSELVAIIGPNGAGKTTFLSLLTGSVKPTEGTIRFKGEDITGQPANEIAQEGLVKSFQETNIFNDASIYENVRLAAQAQKSQYNFWERADSLSAVNEKTEEVLKKFDLAEESDRDVGSLSHGESRIVEMAVVFATDPEMILLDEPSSGMSASETDIVIEKLQGLITEIPILVVEHNMEIVREIADRLIVLHNGKILAEGPYKEVHSNEDVQRVYLQGD